jgi:hypothetical protein
MAGSGPDINTKPDTSVVAKPSPNTGPDASTIADTNTISDTNAFATYSADASANSGTIVAAERNDITGSLRSSNSVAPPASAVQSECALFRRQREQTR